MIRNHPDFGLHVFGERDFVISGNRSGAFMIHGSNVIIKSDARWVYPANCSIIGCDIRVEIVGRVASALSVFDALRRYFIPQDGVVFNQETALRIDNNIIKLIPAPPLTIDQIGEIEVPEGL